jgi:hypothetical protein
LILAKKKGDFGLVKQLLEQDADIEAKDENEWTPLLLGIFLSYSFF